MSGARTSVDVGSAGGGDGAGPGDGAGSGSRRERVDGRGYDPGTYDPGTYDPGTYDPGTYDPRAFDPIAVTVDVVALTIRERALHVLVVRRGEEPFAGRWALPGGFVRPWWDEHGVRHEEDLHEAAARELAEETGLTTAGPLRRVHLEQLGTYGTPGRDPRMRIISVAHLAFAPDLPDPTAGGDAAAAAWLPVAALARDQAAGSTGSAGGGPDAVAFEGLAFEGLAFEGLAFDHGRILADGVERARSKIEYTPLATAFVGDEFTITELREVYTAVWGRAPHAANFHRKVLSVPGFVEDTGATTERGGTRGGRRARLYRAGPARLLHPALLRPAPGEIAARGAAPGEIVARGAAPREIAPREIAPRETAPGETAAREEPAHETAARGAAAGVGGTVPSTGAVDRGREERQR